MKKIVLFLFIVIMSLVFSQKMKVIIHVDDAYFPYSYQQDGVAKGMYVNILKEAFSRMKDFEVTIVPIPWARGKILMKHGKGVGLAPVFYHGHDWGYLYPYSLPFYTETIVAIVKADRFPNPMTNWPEDFVGLSVGNMAGFDGWGGDKFRKLVEQGKIQYEEAKGTIANIKKLAFNRVDCIMMEKGAFAFELRKLKKDGIIPEKMSFNVAAIIGQDPVYIGYSEKNQPEYMQAFRKAFDNEIYKMTKSGEIFNIMKFYH